jgi:hypothetical protein
MHPAVGLQTLLAAVQSVAAGEEHVWFEPQLPAGLYTAPLHDPGQSASTLHCTHPSAVLHTAFIAAQLVVLGEEHVLFGPQLLAGVYTPALHDAGEQSVLALHCTHPLLTLQTSPSTAQLVALPLWQLPIPSHVCAEVNTVFEQLLPAPHDVPDAGYVHAPELSQAVALQVGSPVLHATTQQCPAPATSHTLLVHWILLLHEAPCASVLQWLFRHTVLTQSLGALHIFPVRHGEHAMVFVHECVLVLHDPEVALGQSVSV